MKSTTVYNSKKILAAILVLALGVLSCGQIVTTPTPTAETTPTLRLPTSLPVRSTQTGRQVEAGPPLPTLTASPAPEATAWSATVRQPTVRVRQSPDGPETGDYLVAGQAVTILGCIDNWCYISSPYVGYVWAGCLTVESGLKCQSKGE